jgi:hypothetical protein
VLEQRRQGDVFLQKVDPKTWERYTSGTKVVKASSVLARGEVTGHDHVVSGDVVDVLTNPVRNTSTTSLIPGVQWADGVVWVVVGPGGAVVNHTQFGQIVAEPEHSPVQLPEGVWEVRIQHEYSPETWRRTYD